MSDLKVTIGGDSKDLSRELDKSGKEVNKFAGKTNASLDRLGGDFKKTATVSQKATAGIAKGFDGIAASIGGLVGAGLLLSFGKQVLNTTAEFEKFGAVLGNTLGSDALSKLKMKEIADFAANTPYGVGEITAAFVKLANQGFKPTGDEMRKLGDLAASTGKSFDMLAEAILDAQTGEFERLKEFGVRAKDAGDKVIFTFKGVQTTVEKSSEAIRDYVTALGETKGIAGSMEVISQTLTGQLSNLADNWDSMLVSIGNNTTGIFSDVISLVGQAINKITEYNRKANVAGKYGINASFGERTQGLITREKGDAELKTETIIAIEDDLNKQVSALLAGAKSADDFKAALARLKKEARENIMGTDKNFIAGVADQYMQAIAAIKDGFKAFQAEKNKPKGANFGTTGNDRVTTPKMSEAQKAELEQQKRFAEYKVEGGKFAAKVIIDGIERDALAQIAAQNEANDLMIAAAEAGQMAFEDLPQNDFFRETTLTLSDETKKQIAILQDFNEQVTNIINGALTDTFAGIGEAIGEAFAGGTSLAEGLGKVLLGSLADILMQLGKLAIATGVAMLGIKMAFKNPATAIAAGVALVALSALVSKKAASIGNSVGGGGGAGSPSSGAESGSASFSASGATGGGMSGTVVFEIAGTKLLGVLQATTGRNLRIG